MERTDITQLMDDLIAGRPSAMEKLIPVVYDELREIAHRVMRAESRRNTLQPTALVNEACIRLLGARSLSLNDRAHFFALASVVMRQILASSARARRAAKRSDEGRDRISLSDVAESAAADDRSPSDVDLLALDEALDRLATLNPIHARLVELRFFGGLSVEDASGIMGQSVRSLHRDWRVAKAWLNRELSNAPAEGDDQ
ncbi:MAG: ECF-type sigma factor [Planctomycetota bacterium]|nr:ECF-type sigma factor [Planctomycetota bacterium]